MLFNSYDFLLLFLPGIFILFLIGNAIKPAWNGIVLLSGSLCFYAYWNPAFLPLLLCSIIVNYWIGQYVKHESVLWFGVCLNLISLFWFKYATFVLGAFTSPAHAHSLLGNIILPLGISFYTFHQISYLVDMHRGHVVRPAFTTYAAYVAIFPQLIAGPIVRYHDIDRQIARLLKGIPARRVMVLASSGLALFCLGLFKKVVIADTLSSWADPVFNIAGAKPLATTDAWIGSLAYTFQLYFDFSAYSDMAMGLGRMFSLFMPMNFNSPYKSRSITEFWRRWHMSLSYFVRVYIYIPLGGNQRGIQRQIFNLLLAFTLIGIWHGAGYTFLIWGIYHGVLVVISHLMKRAQIPTFPAIISLPVTFLLVMLGWVIFRAESLLQAQAIYTAMFSFTDGANIFIEPGQRMLGLILIAGAALISFFAPNTVEILGSRRHALLYGLHFPVRRFISLRIALPILAGAAGYFAITSLSGMDSSFLYFNF